MFLESQDFTLESADFVEQFKAHNYLHLLYMDEKKSSPNLLLQQLQLISEQNDLIRQIKDRVYSKEKSLKDEFEGEVQETMDLSQNNSNYLDNSSRTQLFDVSHHFNTETCINETSRTRKRMVMPASQSLELALADIEQHCQRSTCWTISQLLVEIGEKSTSLRTLESSLARFETENLIMKERYQQQTKSVLLLEEKLKTVQSEISVKARAYSDKDRHHTKVQTALVIREEMLGKQAKKLKAKAQLMQDKENQLGKERVELDSIWEQVLLSVKAGNEDQFRTQVYARCKQSLVKQRKVLAQQQQALENQHESIQKMVAKLKEHGAL